MVEKETRHYLFSAPAHAGNRLRALVADALREIGFEPVSPLEGIAAGTSWVGVIEEAIEQADFVIVDLSENNSNVMYEVGYARALRKPVLPIVQTNNEQVPSDLMGYQYLVYDPAKPDDFRRHIRNLAIHYLS